jgi:hypothetical protein
MACQLCESCGWVCEEHPGRPRTARLSVLRGRWALPLVQRARRWRSSRMPDGFKTDVDKESQAGH